MMRVFAPSLDFCAYFDACFHFYFACGVCICLLQTVVQYSSNYYYCSGSALSASQTVHTLSRFCRGFMLPLVHNDRRAYMTLQSGAQYGSVMADTAVPSTVRSRLRILAVCGSCLPLVNNIHTAAYAYNGT